MNDILCQLILSILGIALSCMKIGYDIGKDSDEDE